MREVWKFPVEPSPKLQRLVVQALKVHPIHLGEDGTGRLCMWAEVHRQGPDARWWAINAVTPPEVESPVVMIDFAVLGTGWRVPGWLEHAATCVSASGYVWHLYRDRAGSTS